MKQDTLDQLVRLFTLADDAAAQRVSERLQLVLRDPTAYFQQFAAELDERGITAVLPAQELRDIALIDALLAEDLAWESDWKENASEMAEGVNEILTRQKRAQRLQPATLRGRRESGPEQLDTLQDALEPIGLALVLFTLDSDSYPLSVVADERAEEARQLAKLLGFNVTIY